MPLTMVGEARSDLEIRTIHDLQGIKTDNVIILANLPFENVRQLLWTSKVLLHTADSEPFDRPRPDQK